MDNAGYIALTRQSGLLDQLDVIATNVANADTTGYRREATVFSEYVKIVGGDVGSISMASMRARYADVSQGVLQATGGPLDVAIEGDGFFTVETPNGPRLTRAGSFTTNQESVLVTLEGYPVLDAGGAPIFVPLDAPRIAIGRDGTLSAGEEDDLIEVGQIGIVTVDDPTELRRDGSTLLIADQALLPAENAVVVQGFLEGSNVNMLAEITRLVEVQRAYELGQNLMDKEAQRVELAIRTLGRATS